MVGELRIDLGRHEVFDGSRRLALTPKEFKLPRPWRATVARS